MCTTVQTRSVPPPSFPNCRLRESQRLIAASLPLCHTERVQRAPELLSRPQDHRCYAVQPKQPLSILPTHFPSRSAASLLPAPPTNDEAYRWPCILTDRNRPAAKFRGGRAQNYALSATDSPDDKRARRHARHHRAGCFSSTAFNTGRL